jgi:hypothetical protein
MANYLNQHFSSTKLCVFQFQKILIERDLNQKTGIPLCSSLLDTGKCTESFFCKDRHTLSLFDAPDADIPKKGKVSLN